MNYYRSYDTARSRHSQFLLDELIKLSVMVPTRSSNFGRPLDFPLPALFVLLGLKFDSGLSYRDFVARLSLSPLLLQRLGLERPPSYSILQKALKRPDTRLLHRMYRLLARKRPPPRDITVDSTGFSHSTGGEWMTARFKKTRRRRFTYGASRGCGHGHPDGSWGQGEGTTRW